MIFSMMPYFVYQLLVICILSSVVCVKSQVVPIDVGSPFPYSTGLLSDTNSAQQNYKTGCAVACNLDILTFSACGGDIAQDTFLRLFLGDIQVAQNDDACNSASLLEYKVNSTGCDTYCLHMGCFGLSMCDMNVTGTTLSTATLHPTINPTEFPTGQPSRYPSSTPTRVPLAGRPTGQPSTAPSSAPSGQPIFIPVRNLTDGISNSSTCYPVTTDACNLRSAWAACVELFDYTLNTACHISLPENGQLSLDSVDFGGLVLSQSSDLIIDGNGAVISGQVGGVPEAVPAGGDFPIYTGEITNSYSATVNYTVACTQACFGNTLTFSSCDADRNQDTYFRLFSGDTLLAENDDACTAASSIQYTVETPGCSEFCLHMGCFATTPCAVNATATVVVSTISPRFAYYRQNESSASEIIPRFTLDNVTIQGFGGSSFNGGALYLSGQGRFLIQNSKFMHNTGAFGGSMFVSSNSFDFMVDNCEFANSTGTYGGGFYINNYVTAFQLINSKFDSCIAGTAGGGGYFAMSNYDARVEDCQFQGCSAVGITSSTGGALTIDVDNANFLLLNSQFNLCHSNWYGGCLAFLRENTNVSVVESIFISSRAGYGGAVFIGDQNIGVSVIDSTLSNCSSFIGSGGAIYVYTSNTNITLKNTSITDCHATNRGGGLFMFQYNDRLKLLDSTFDGCTAQKIGGAFECMYNNDGLEFTNTVFSNCYSGGSGGAINMDGYNNNFIVSNCSFHSCRSEVFGGAIRLVSGHQNVQLRSSLFDSSTSLQGGAIQLEEGNENVTIFDCIFSNSNAGINGGTFALNSSNANIALINSVISNSVSGATGGAIALWTDNAQFSLINSSITNATSKSGGGIYALTGNDYMSVENSQIVGCSANLDFGGGIYMYNNAYLTLINSSIVGNYGTSDGGGLASYTNIGTVIAGSVFCNNTAGKNGGGVWLGESNTELVVIDFEGYEHSVMMESSHPYASAYPTGSSPYTIYSRYVKIDDVTSFILNFDVNTAISHQDVLNIYTNESMAELVFTSHGVGWPGVSTPSLVIPGSSFYLSFTGVNSFEVAPTTAEDGYYGFKCSAFPVMGDPSLESSFVNNTAIGGGGGGLYMHSNCPFPVIVSSSFYSNTAQFGGGVFLRNGIVGVSLVSCAFTDNRAVFDGGAVVVYTTNYGYSVIDCPFEGNSAARDGGAVELVTGNGVGSLLSGNEISFQRCTWKNNEAVSHGGAVAASADNVVIINACRFDNNAGGLGGGVFADQNNNISLSNSYVIANSATQAGGGLAFDLNNHVYVTSMNISYNSAGTIGGGLRLMGDSITHFNGDSHVHGNSAKFAGGGVAISQSPLWSLATNGSLMLVSNTADRGSAIYLNDLVHNNEVLHDLMIMYNVAGIGGTVFWMYGAMTEEPAGISSESNTWMGNVAPYAPKVGTQAISIIGPSAYEVTVYGGALNPAPTFQLYDFYDHLLHLDGSTTISASINTANVSCHGQSPLLAGSNMFGSGVPVQNTTAVFSALEVYCSPQGSMEVMFQATNVGGVASEYTIRNTTLMSFRSCVAGEKYTARQCEVCPPGSFSLQADAYTCSDCLGMTGVKECYSNQLDLDPGYWRRYPTNEEVMACDSDVGCIGGNLTGDGVCALGYTGPLCSVCAEGYFSVSGLCVACAGSVMTPTLIAYICVFLVMLSAAIVAVYIYFRYFRLHFESQLAGRYSFGDRPSERISAAGSLHMKPNDEPVPPLVTLCVKWLKRNFARLASQMKIIVSTYQVITSASTVLDVTMPTSFTNFADVADFLNLNLSGALPFACSGSYSFIDHLFITTLAPVAISLLILVGFVFEWTRARIRIQNNHNRRRGAKRRKFNQLFNKYFKYFLYLAYMVLPSVSTIIFQMFPCVDVDPANEDTGMSDLFLRADMSISCSSDYYYSGVAYATLMILVYPVGIPGLYLLLLFRRRDLIRSRSVECAHDEDDDGDGDGDKEPEASVDDINENNEAIHESSASTNTGTDGDSISGSDAGPVSDGVARDRSVSQSSGSSRSASGGKLGIHPDIAFFSFLWISYRPEFWFWELIETSRRVVLTAVLSIIAPGEPLQSLLAVLLALFYLKLYDYFNPYVRSYNNSLSDVGNIQILLTFYGILAIQQQMLSDSYVNVLGYVLIAVNLSVLFYTFFKVVSRSLGKVMSIQEEMYKDNENPFLPNDTNNISSAKDTTRQQESSAGPEVNNAVDGEGVEMQTVPNSDEIHNVLHGPLAAGKTIIED